MNRLFHRGSNESVYQEGPPKGRERKSDGFFRDSIISGEEGKVIIKS